MNLWPVAIMINLQFLNAGIGHKRAERMTSPRANDRRPPGCALGTDITFRYGHSTTRALLRLIGTCVPCAIGTSVVMEGGQMYLPRLCQPIDTGRGS
jgi:hypothetical protein